MTERTDGADARPEITRPDFTLCLYRATNHERAMVAFLEAVGLHRTVYRDQDGAAFMWGHGGMVALFHGEGRARPSRSELTFETPDLDAAEAYLNHHGLQTRRAHGEYRGFSVTAPCGQTVWISESFRDPDDFGTGYRDVPIHVVGLHISKRAEADEEFFKLLGFHHPRQGLDCWRILYGDESSGAISIDQGNAVADKAGPVMVQLGFSTEEPIAEVAARLRDAGHPVGEILPVDGFEYFVVSDPDGITIAVHQSQFRSLS